MTPRSSKTLPLIAREEVDLDVKAKVSVNIISESPAQSWFRQRPRVVSTETEVGQMRVGRFLDIEVK